jgi:phage-related protein
MAEGMLPPAIQEFVADATAWTEGIDAMIEDNERLLESIAQVSAAAKDAGLSAATEDVSATAAGATEGVAGAEVAAGSAAGADAAAASTAGLATAQEDVTTTAREAAGADEELSDMERLAGEMAADAKAEMYMLNDAYWASVEAARASASAQALVKDAEAASGDAAVTSATKTDGAGEAAAAGSGKFKMLGLAMAAGAAISVKMAGTFQQSMTRLVTSAGETQKNIGLVSKGILALSVSTNTNTSQLASGMYLVESAGFHGARGLTVLKAAAEGAQAEGADLATVSNAVTSGLNAYGLGANKATALTDEMVTAVGRGKMTMQQLAASLSAVLPVASAAHLSFAQVGGGIATMTAQGMSAQWAAQNLRHTIVALQNPNNVQIQQMQQLGINSNALAKNLGKEGLTGTLNEIYTTIMKNMGPAGMVLLKSFNQSKLAAQSANEMIQAMPPSLQKLAHSYQEGKISSMGMRTALYALSGPQANLMKQFETVTNTANGFNNSLKSGNGDAQTFTAALSKIMGGSVGLQTSLMLTGQHTSVFDANVKAVADSAKHAGDNVNNWALIQKNFNFQMGAAEKSAKAMGISLGEALLPAATKVMKAFAAFGEWLTKHSAASKAFAIIIGTILAGALEHQLVKGLSASVHGFEDLYKAGKGAIGFFRAGEEGASKFGSILSKIGSVSSSTFSGIAKVASVTWSGITTAATATWSAVSAGAQAAWEAIDATFLTNPVTLIIIGIALLVVAFIELWKHCKAFRDFWKDAWRDIKQWAEDAYDFLIDDVFHPIERAVDDAVKLIKQYWYFLPAIFLGPIAIIVAIIYTFRKQIAEIFEDAWDDVKKATDDAWSLIKGVINRNIAAIKAILGWFARLGSLFKGWFMDAYHAIVSAWGDAESFIRSIPGRVISALSRLGSMLYNAGANAIHRLADGIRSAIGDVTSSISGIASKVAGFFGLSPAKEGPLSGGGAPEIRGQHFAAAFAEGIMSGSPAVAAAVRAMAGLPLAVPRVSGPVTSGLTAGTALGASALAQPAVNPAYGVGAQSQAMNLNLTMTWPTSSTLRRTDQRQTLRYNKRNPQGNGLTLQT